MDWKDYNKKGEGEKYRGERRFTDANEVVLQALRNPYFDIPMMRNREDVRWIVLVRHGCFQEKK